MIIIRRLTAFSLTTASLTIGLTIGPIAHAQIPSPATMAAPAWTQARPIPTDAPAPPLAPPPSPNGGYQNSDAGYNGNCYNPAYQNGYHNDPNCYAPRLDPGYNQTNDPALAPPSYQSGPPPADPYTNNGTPTPSQTDNPLGTISNLYQSIRQARSGSVYRTEQLPPGATDPAGNPNQIILYRTASCSPCQQAASYLQQKSIPYIERDVQTSRDALAQYKQLGGGGVPLILFGRASQRGFSPTAIDRAYQQFQQSQAR